MGADGAPAGAARATALATSISVCANLVGAGLLSLPYTLKRAGLVTGVAAMTTMCVLNAFSVLLIARCCDLSKKYSYLDVGRSALGPAAGVVITAIMAVYTLGSCVSFTVLLGDFLPALVCEGGCDGLPPLAAAVTGRTVLIVLVSGLVLFPLSLQRDLNNLRFTSTLSAVCIVYTALMVSARAIRGPTVPLASLALTTGSEGLFVSLPVTCVAFTLHYNVPRFYFELQRRSLARMAAVTTASYAFVYVLYVATAVGGYLLFGSATVGDVLSNFGDSDVPALVARVALSFIVIGCYPLAFNSLRGSASALLPAAWRAALRAPAERRAAAVEGGAMPPAAPARDGGADRGDLDCALLSDGGEGGDDDVSGSGDGPRAPGQGGCGRRARSAAAAVAADWPHAALTLALVATTTVIGVGVPKVEVVLGYKGALGGSLIVYLFPASMFFALQERRRRRAAGGPPKAADGAEEEEERAEAEAEESAPLRGDGAPRSCGAALATPHGALLVVFGIVGLMVMVFGTATTAGIL